MESDIKLDLNKVDDYLGEINNKLKSIDGKINNLRRCCIRPIKVSDNYDWSKASYGYLMNNGEVLVPIYKEGMKIVPIGYKDDYPIIPVHDESIPHKHVIMFQIDDKDGITKHQIYPQGMPIPEVINN